jgi:hypothetical protein
MAAFEMRIGGNFEARMSGNIDANMHQLPEP